MFNPLPYKSGLVRLVLLLNSVAYILAYLATSILDFQDRQKTLLMGNVQSFTIQVWASQASAIIELCIIHIRILSYFNTGLSGQTDNFINGQCLILTIQVWDSQTNAIMELCSVHISILT